MVVFDIHGLGEQLKPIGHLVITDTMLNRVTLNWKKGKRTHVFIDEFHVMFENEFSAAFFNSAWRQFRKRNAYPTAITQNVEYLLDSVQASTMLSNSEFIVMLNQAASDREKLARLLNISEEALRLRNCRHAELKKAAENSFSNITWNSSIKTWVRLPFFQFRGDRCTGDLYENAKHGGPAPTLTALREMLLEQPESEARGIALALEAASGHPDDAAQAVHCFNEGRVLPLRVCYENIIVRVAGDHGQGWHLLR